MWLIDGVASNNNRSIPRSIRLRYKIAVLLVSVFLSCLSIEIVFRVFPGLIPESIRSYFPYYGLYLFDHSSSGLIPDDDLGFRYEPFSKSLCHYAGDLVYLYNLSTVSDSDYSLVSLSYDADGFRNPCTSESGRVIIIGDSMIEALAVTDNELFYCLDSTRPLRIRTLATSTYCSAQYMTLLKRHALKDSPELVIVSIFESNDIDDRQTFEQWKSSGLTFTQYLRKIIPAKNRSILFNLARYGKGVFELKFNRPAERMTIRDRPSFEYPEVQLTEHQTGYIGTEYFKRIVRTKSEWILTPGYTLLLKDLNEMSAFCHEAGVSFAVMLMPDKAHVYIDSIVDSLPEETLRAALGRSSRNPETPGSTFRQEITDSVESLRELTEEWCAAQDNVFIDLLPPFRESAARGDILYGKFDTHLNAKGHERLAEILSERISFILKSDYSSHSNSTESH